MNSKRVRQGKRGQSEVLGVVLLLGLVLAGALIVVMMGSSTVSDIQQQQSDQGAAVVVQEIDSRLQSLSGVGDTKSKEFVVDEALPRELKLKENTGYLNITVNNRAACSVNVSLDTIQQTNSEGQVVGLQGGGVWTKSSDGGSAMIAGPDVTFENGTLDISLVNMSGNIDKGTNTAVRNVTASRNRTRTISETLFSGPCSNLDNATIRINSQFSDAWAEYLRQETGVGASNVAVSGDEMELFIPEKQFPRRVDNDRNQVVNFSSAASYMDSVSIDNGTIEFDKNAGNDYRVFVSALDSWKPNIGGIRNFSGNVSGVERKPIDFVVVLDKSGSMGTGPSSKRQEARDAAKAFVGITEFKKGDRIGLVGYDRWPNYVKPKGRLLSSDPAALNNSISNNFDLHPSCTNPSKDNQCNTDFADALQHANAMLDLRSNTNERDKHILLLTDGRARPADKCEDYWEKEIEPGVDNLYESQPSCYYSSNNTRPVNKYAVRYANNSAKSNITIHTVAFGSGANPAILKRIKNQTEGGTYSKASVGSLVDVFKAIGNNITNSREVIALDPLSTNVSTGSGVVTPPQVPGDTSGLATMTAGGKRFVNVNDPTAPSRFSHALPVSGGTEFNLSAYSATCNQWQGTTQVKTNSTSGDQYPVVRCANMSSPQRMQPDNVTVITDEANISSKALNNNSAWWQPNMSDMLNDSQIYNSSTGTYELDSNEGLALLKFNNNGSSDPAKVIPVVFRVGISEASVSSTDIINVEVSEVKIED